VDYPVDGTLVRASEALGPEAADERAPRVVTGPLGSVWVDVLAYRRYFVELDPANDQWMRAPFVSTRTPSRCWMGLDEELMDAERSVATGGDQGDGA